MHSLVKLCLVRSSKGVVTFLEKFPQGIFGQNSLNQLKENNERPNQEDISGS